MGDARLFLPALPLLPALPALCFLLSSASSWADSGTLIVATTTSTQDSGLLDVLVPVFERQTGIRVRVIAVGTGQALEVGRRGDADVVLVHSGKDEEDFVRKGYGVQRKEVMYNDFVIVGPTSDPAKVRGEKSAAKAFVKVARSRSAFISRADESGTHKKEQEVWQKAKVKPKGEWYIRAGAGMGEALRMADERCAYVLSDRGTYLAQRSNLRLTILCEGDPILFNPYGAIAVNPSKFPHVNFAGAKRFIRFLTSPAVQRLITDFGRKKYGQPLFRGYLFIKERRRAGR